MEATLTKYSLSEIKKGMRVHKEQLSNIYDIWIILYRPKQEVMDDGEMIIGYIGKELSEESAALYNSENIITPVYNDSMDLEGDVFYEE